MPTRPLVAGAGLCALLFGACGSSAAPDDSASSTLTSMATTTSSTTEATVPTTQPEGEDWRLSALETAQTGYGAPGAVAVVLTGDEPWAGAVGAADLDGTPAEVSMRFRAASITKPIVAALALRLVGEGLIGLDQSVEEVLPGVLRPDRPVTIRQLLDHTSGVFNEGDEGDPVADVAAIADPELRAEAEAFMAAYLAGEPIVASGRVFVALAETRPRYFEAGTGFHYSNANYQIVAMVIETVTGHPLASVLADMVSGPLSLGSFSLAPTDRSSPELRGYELPSDGEPFDATDNLVAFGNGGSGGVLTTAGDLAHFFGELLAGRVVAPDLLEEMKQPSEPSRALGAPYGLGLGIYRLSCGMFYGHEGGVDGTVSIAMADGEGRRVVVIAFNGRSASDPGLPALADRLVCGEG